MSNVGYATLQVIPSMKGVQGALAGEAGPGAAAAGSQAGGLFASKFGAVLGGGVLAAGAVAATAGVLAAIGGQFDEAFDTIRVGTGATGDALSVLKDDFRAVVADVPTSFGNAATAITGLQQRLGISHKPLQDLSEQFLELSRITKSDLSTNIDNITRVFGDWSIQTGEMPGALDELFRATQASGIGIDELSSQVVQFGAPLRSLGFGFTDSLALFSRFSAEGVNTSTVMSGMRQAVKNLGSGFAEQETGVSSFADIIAGVKDGTFDLQDAFKVFGARGATDVFRALQEGRFDLAAFTNQIANGTDTIRGAARDTDDWHESLTVLKNNALLLIEPVATRVFNALGSGAQVLSRLVDAFRQGGVAGAAAFLGIEKPVQGYIDILTKARDELTAFFGSIGDHLSGLNLSPLLDGFSRLSAAVKPLLDRIGGFKTVFAVFLAATNPILAIGAGFVFLYNKSSLFRTVIDFITQGVVNLIGSLATVTAFTIDGLTIGFTAVANAVRSVWSFLEPVRRVISVIAVASFEALRAQVNGVIAAVRIWWEATAPVRAILNVIGSIAFVSLRAAIGTTIALVRVLWAGSQPARTVLAAIGSLAWSALKSAIGTVRTAITTVWEKAQPLRSVLSAIGSMGLGALKSAVATIRSAFERISGVLDSIASKIRSLPSLPSLHIPGLATGGFMGKGSTALVGESGRELFVAPDDGFILPNGVTERVLSRFTPSRIDVNDRAGGSAPQTLQPIVLELDGQEVGRVIVPIVRDLERSLS